MSDLQDAIEALKAADAAGNVEDARKLAAVVESLSSQPQAESSGSFMDTASQFAYGVNEKLADIIDAPGRMANAITGPIVNTVANLFRTEQEDYQPNPSQSVLTAPLRGNPDPVSGPQRIARRVGEEVGATAPFAAVPFLGALARTGLPAANTAPTIMSSVVQGVKNTPVAAATGELAATLGSGAGAGVAGEIAPGNTTAEITGQLLGGVTPTVIGNMPAALAVRGGRALASRFAPEALNRAAQKEVGEVVGPHMSDSGLNEAERLRETIPGFNPSLAEATGSPALIATQRRIEREAAGAELETLAARRRANESAVQTFITEKSPETDLPLDYVIDTANRRVQNLRYEVGRPIVSIERRQREAAGALPTADRSAVGETLRTTLVNERTKARDTLGRLADSLGLNDVDMSIPFGRIRNEIVAEFTPGSVFDDIKNYPEVVEAIRSVNPVRRNPQTGQMEPQPITFNDLKALRERITDDLLDAQAGANPSRKKVRSLAALKAKVDGAIDELGASTDPNIAQNYTAFRQAYFEQYIERFEKGAAFKVRQKDGRGFYKTPDERVAQAFFAPGDVSAARQFKTVYGDNLEANAALEATVLDSLRDSTVRDGRIVPELFETWMRKHQSVLSEFPQIQRGVESAQELVTALSTRQAQLVSRQSGIEDRVLVRELNALERGTKTAESVIDSAVKDPRKMDQVVNSLRGNPEALNALKRHIWDSAANLNGKELGDFLTTFDKSLKRALGPTHYGDLVTISKARQMMDRMPEPKGQGYSPNPLKDIEQSIGMGIPQIGSRVFAVESGRTSARYMITDAFGRFMRGRSQARSEALLKEALYNPEVARDLATMTHMSKVPHVIARRLYVRLFNLGQGTRDDQPQ